MVWDSDSLSYVVWDGAAFSQVNPQKSGKDGGYELLLPPGRYYIEVAGKGYRRLRSEIFEVKSPSPINQDLVLKEELKTKIGPLTIIWPGFGQTETVIRPPAIGGSGEDGLVGKTVPEFTLADTEGKKISLSDFRGKEVLLALMNLWAPGGLEEILILDKYQQEHPDIAVVVVMEQEREERVKVFKDRGGYKLLTVLSDEDGQIGGDYHFLSAPLLIAIDRRGEVRVVERGVRSGEEIERMMGGK